MYVFIRRIKTRYLALLLVLLLIAGLLPIAQFTSAVEEDAPGSENQTSIDTPLDDSLNEARNLAPDVNGVGKVIANKEVTYIEGSDGLFDINLYVAGINCTPKYRGIDVVFVVDT